MHAPPSSEPAPKSGFSSTGCLIALFALGGIGLGLVVLMGVGVAAGVWYVQMAG